MDQRNTDRSALIRTLVAGALVLGLMQSAGATEALSWLTRPAVAAVLQIFGGHAVDGGSYLLIGRLRVPWSRDCAGFDVLLVLWGLILWSSRSEPVSWRFWLRMVLAVPASILANVARIITIIGWREAFYPAVESPQMHYFVGFLWLLPLLAVFVPRGGRLFAGYAVETGMLAAALSLVAPQATAPGGVWVTVCALLLLAAQTWHQLKGRLDIALACAWFAGAVFIAGAAMESLWLPWLLLCPWCFPKRWLLSPAILLLPGTVPVFVMHFGWLTIPGIAAALWMLLKSHEPLHAHTAPAPRWPTAVLLLFAMLVPFVASTLGPALQTSPTPPVGVMSQQLNPNSFLLRFPAQPNDLSVTWNAPNGSGRHHTLSVCMRYRGTKISSVASCPGVETDGRAWLAEAFLMPGGELLDYDGYLHATLLPFTPAGIHLIASAPKAAMPAARFRDLAQAHFQRVAKLEQARSK